MGFLAYIAAYVAVRVVVSVVRFGFLLAAAGVQAVLRYGGWCR